MKIEGSGSGLVRGMDPQIRIGSTQKCHGSATLMKFLRFFPYLGTNCGVPHPFASGSNPDPDTHTVGNMEHEPGEHTRMIFLRVMAQQLSSPTRLPDSLATVSWLTHRSSCPNCNHIVATVRKEHRRRRDDI
jgi:hypothetical protein